MKTIGIGLMEHEAIALGLASMGCDTCKWLERGYQTSDSIAGIEAYATEILLHRRSLHISSADNIN